MKSAVAIATLGIAVHAIAAVQKVIEMMNGMLEQGQKEKNE